MECLMTKENKENLIKNRTHIVDNISLNYIQSSLVSTKVLTLRDVKEIEAKTGHQQAECFLDILAKKPNSAYDTFITVLRDNDQEHIANLLELSATASLSRAEESVRTDELESRNQQIQQCEEDYIDEKKRLIGLLANNDFYKFKESVSTSERNDRKRPKRDDNDINARSQVGIDEERNTYRDFINFSSRLDSDNQQQLVKESVWKEESVLESSIRSWIRRFKTNQLLALRKSEDEIHGIAGLNRELFLTQKGSSQVRVLNKNNHSLSRNITSSGSSNLQAIVASPRDNCLYISDVKQGVVYRRNLSNENTTEWEVGGRCRGLSLTRTNNVLVTLEDTNQVKEYSPDGRLIRVISLDSSIESPVHCVQLSSDRLVISHGGNGTLHRVCIVDNSGHILQSYGGLEGSDDEQLSYPGQLAVDRHGIILVTDTNNDRVVLLSPSLTHFGYLTVPGHELNHPSALHLDERNHRLYVGELSGNLFVLDIKDKG